MNEDLSTALVLFGVGMITVFLVLCLVVVLGYLLIYFVNKFLPATIPTLHQTRSNTNVESSKIAAITAAVEVFTKGKGRIVSIKKSEKS